MGYNDEFVTVTVSTAKGLVNGRPFAWVTPEEFGAVGDAVTTDADALRLAITAAGVDGVIVLRPGATYIVDGKLDPLSGQTFIGYGAKIKRRNEAASTTTTPIASGTGTRTFTVANAAGFRVGMDVVLYSGPYPSSDGKPHRIVAINFNAITTGGELSYDVAFPSGCSVVSAFPIFSIAASCRDVNILGLEIDGNRQGNTSYLDWRIEPSITTLGNHTTIRDCYIHDNQADGVILGGIGSIVDNCYIVDNNANGVHLSGTTSPKVVNCYIKNSNLTGTTTGHSEGSITFSDSIFDAIIAHNTFDTAISGIGSIDAPSGNADATIVNNVFKNMTAQAIYIGGPGANLFNYTITGNRFYDCLPINFDNTGAFDATKGPSRIIFGDNLLQNTALTMSKCTGVIVRGNTFVKTASGTLASNQFIYLVDSDGVVIQGNQFIGHLYAINFATTSGAGTLATKNILMANNRFKDQTVRAINAYSPSTGVYENVTIDGNVFTNIASGTNPNYQAINAGARVNVRNNTITLARGHGVEFQRDGGLVLVAAVGGVCIGNTVRVAVGDNAINLAVGSSGIVAVQNFTSAAIVDGGTGNTVTPNYLV